MINENMINAKQAYRTLEYFFENNIAIHFSLTDSGWKNGIILDLSEKKLTMVLKEFKEGVIPILLEKVNVNTIKEYTKPMDKEDEKTIK